MINGSCESNEMMTMTMMARGNAFSMNSSFVDDSFLVSPTLPPLVETSTQHHNDYTTSMDPTSSTIFYSQTLSHQHQQQEPEQKMAFVSDTQNYSLDPLQMSVASQETAMSTDHNPDEISSLGLEIGCGHYYDDDDGFENLWK